MKNSLEKKLNIFLNGNKSDKKIKPEETNDTLYIKERDELVERVDRTLKFKDGRQLLREQLYESNS